MVSKQNTIIIILVGEALLFLLVLGALNAFTWFLKDSGYYGESDWKGCEADESFYYLAIQSQDPSRCEKLICPAVKDSCYGFVAVNKNESSLCSKIKDNNSRDFCIDYFITELREIELCDSINDSSDKLRCEGICLNDTSICDKIPEGTYQKGDCYLQININRENISYCEGLGPYNMDRCYSGMAYRQINASVCDKINETFSNDVCYNNLAVKTKNISYCNTPHGFLERDCKRNIEKMLAQNANLHGVN